VGGIDPQLEQAGWYLLDHSKVKSEIPVDGYYAEPWSGVSDDTLYRENGEVLAVVEAKKTAVDVRLAEAQLTHYVTEIEKHQSFRLFGFLANGLKVHFVDVGLAHKREIFGFFTREDLENLLYICQNAMVLSSVEIDTKIVDRSYQHEAIRRVCEAFEIPSRRRSPEPVQGFDGSIQKAGLENRGNSKEASRTLSLPPSLRFWGLRRGRMGESERQAPPLACRSVERLIESLLAEAFKT
jgi:hypothetical protein